MHSSGLPISNRLVIDITGDLAARRGNSFEDYTR
jgi:hypothetical protein